MNLAGLEIVSAKKEKIIEKVEKIPEKRESGKIENMVAEFQITSPSPALSLTPSPPQLPEKRIKRQCCKKPKVPKNTEKMSLREKAKENIEYF